METLQKVLLAGATLVFIIVIGGAVYEHLAVVPRWRQAPPRSLSMFAGPYGLKAERFWMPVHPVCLLLFIGALIVNWKTNCRTPLLIAACGYAAILVITAIYFVPELMRIVGTPYSDTVDTNLMKRARMWELLSLVRLVVLIVLACVLLSAPFKGAAGQVQGSVNQTGAS